MRWRKQSRQPCIKHLKPCISRSILRERSGRQSHLADPSVGLAADVLSLALTNYALQLMQKASQQLFDQSQDGEEYKDPATQPLLKF